MSALKMSKWAALRKSRPGLPFDVKDRHDRYTPSKKSTLKPEVLDAIKVSKIGNVSGYDVWGVDGEAVRDLVDIDFNIGGNPARYAYCPPGEIWVESFLDPADSTAVILHERVETEFMIVAGYDYSGAHDKANEYEARFRAAIADGKVTVGSVGQIIPSIADSVKQAVAEAAAE